MLENRLQFRNDAIVALRCQSVHTESRTATDRFKVNCRACQLYRAVHPSTELGGLKRNLAAAPAQHSIAAVFQECFATCTPAMPAGEQAASGHKASRARTCVLLKRCVGAM